MNKLRLSHSALQTYKTCGQKYKLHYHDRLRDTTIGSALFFGSALDSAIEIVLLRKKKVLTEQETEKLKLNAEDVFVERMTNVNINNETVDIRESLKASYFKSDYSPHLLLDEYIPLLKMSYPDVTKTSLIEFIDECYEIIKSKNKLDSEDNKLFNHIHWLCLLTKGKLLIKAYEEQILPNINEVYEIQKAIKLSDEDDNSLIGYIDFIADWKDEGKVIFDNKTSSKKYTENSVRESQQLTIYSENEEYYKAGFIVMLKNIKPIDYKKCVICGTETTRNVYKCAEMENNVRCNGEFITTTSMRGETQVVIDTLVHEEQEKTFKEIGEITLNIKEEKFDKNWDSCFNYGRRCPYYDYCRNGNKDGLVELKKE